MDAVWSFIQVPFNSGSVNVPYKLKVTNNKRIMAHCIEKWTGSTGSWLVNNSKTLTFPRSLSALKAAPIIQYPFIKVYFQHILWKKEHTKCGFPASTRLPKVQLYWHSVVRRLHFKINKYKINTESNLATSTQACNPFSWRKFNDIKLKRIISIENKYSPV